MLLYSHASNSMYNNSFRSDLFLLSDFICQLFTPLSIGQTFCLSLCMSVFCLSNCLSAFLVNFFCLSAFLITIFFVNLPFWSPLFFVYLPFWSLFLSFCFLVTIFCLCVIRFLTFILTLFVSSVSLSGIFSYSFILLFLLDLPLSLWILFCFFLTTFTPKI